MTTSGYSVVVSTNLITDLKFKKELGVKADSAAEVLAVINNNNNRRENDAEGLGPIPLELRPDLQVNVKLFLGGFSGKVAVEAVDHVRKTLGVSVIDSLTISTPAKVIDVIGIGAHPVGGSEERSRDEGVSPDRRKATADMVDLWNSITKHFMVDSKSVASVGLCDLETDVFMTLYAEAVTKPNNFQVNLKSCCVVPPELQSFAEEKGVKLHTHGDPPTILTSDFLSKIDRDKMAKNNWKDPEWIVRYQLFIKARGVLHDKRYIIPV